jgi:diguanylate cyclase (GGDEF)-like protein/PAS domain S-box-containing protein
MRVLVADDDAAGRYLLESVLRSAGHEVVSACDGVEAMKKAREVKPDAIVTDVLMPRMDGYKLCVRLKNDPGLRDVPILVYTASFGDPADQRFALSLGVESFLVKPQDPEVLIAEVGRLLEKGGGGRGSSPAPDEPGMLQEYGERVSQKLYQKLIEVEHANAELQAAMTRLNQEVDAKSALVKELSRVVAREQETLEALVVSQERYGAAIRGANDGIWDWNLDTGEFFGSPRFRAVLGMRDEDPLLSAEHWLERVRDEDIERLRIEIDLHLRGLTPHFESEFRVSAPDGSARWLLGRGQALCRDDGSPYRIAGSISDVTDRKRQEEQLLRHALYDGLTGLANRTLFMDRMSFLDSRRQRHAGYGYAVLFVDLDRFKNANDSLGRDAGDRILVEVAQRIAGCARSGDTIARFGGDEFVILLDEVSDLAEAHRCARAIHQALMTPVIKGDQEVYTSASVGIAMSRDGQSADGLLQDVEAAMYRAKEAGRARSEVFDEQMHEHAIMVLEVEAQLRRGLERGEIVAYFQPVVSLATGAISSFEALARWEHPDRGLVAPGDFIPVADESGLIVPVGLAIMRDACREAVAWATAGGPTVRVSVNISARQFAEPDLLASVEQILAETGIAPDRLILELTESVVMTDPERAAATLDALHRLGLDLAVDDFGTGYSSLSYLKRFPFNSLKVDRSFVMDIPRDADDMTIVEAVVGLAHSLHMTVTAEGVETSEHLGFLRGLGCDEVQGFLASMPVPADEAARMIRDDVRLLP